ncbi:MAG: class I SAM-dependent methyltransferase [Tateyamaria sp.]|uniref:class I SAM-dependent methyltransferase n=1 Tax=Tateyamaria sp. TaxID=1929288 RepID=UPI0032A12170
MTKTSDPTVKRNVQQFDADVSETGSYSYTADRLSSQLANARISEAIADIYPFEGKRVLDVGCGDGAYTVEFAELGVTRILGVDPAEVAIDAATARAQRLGVGDKVQFLAGNVYDLGDFLASDEFDIVVLRGVLHHLPDPARAVTSLEAFDGAVLILEPNGLNPVLKVLEKVSRYHIEHEERSFTPGTLRGWCTSAGYRIETCKVINLVPFFCPDWMARALRVVEPLVERIPAVRAISCGQTILLAKRGT